MVSLLGIHHFALSVSDLDASIAWYRDHLGFALERRFGFPEARTEIAHVVSASGIRIELLWTEGSTENPDQGLDAFGAISHQGAKHIGILVEDVDAACEELRSHGVTILHEPVSVEPAGVRNFWVLDNEGHHIEFNEWLKRP